MGPGTVDENYSSYSVSPIHPLLLLADSALPLGSFAFSSGLESFLAHHKHISATIDRTRAFDAFLDQSIANLASTALPYVLSAYHDPRRLESLDNAFDAATPCTVARRASVSQGRALLTIWERAISATVREASSESRVAAETLDAFAARLKAPKPDVFGLQPNAHFPALFGTTSRALSISASDAGYLFLLNHAKAVLSAAVRASVIGPYQSQAILADSKTQTCIKACLAREREKTVEDCAVTTPTMDLWMGRHELLYSRIFNS